MKYHTPLVVFIRGLPGSGKTYLSEHLAKALATEKPLQLDPDATDHDSPEYKAHVMSQIEEGVDEKLHPYRFLRAKAFKAIDDNRIILWNQPFTNTEAFQKVAAKLLEYAKQNGKDLKILIVDVSIDNESAKKRVDQRKASGGHGPSDSTFARFVKDNENFRADNYPSVSINGDAPIEDSVQTVVKKLSFL